MCAIAIPMKRSLQTATTLKRSTDEFDTSDNFNTTQQPPRKRRKVVSFSSNVQIKQVDSDSTEQEDSTTWLPNEAHQRFRETALQDARMMQQLNYRGVVDQFWSSTTSTTASLRDQNMDYWCTWCGNGRGLENSVSRKLHASRKQARSQTIRAVMVGQQLLRDEKASSSSPSSQQNNIDPTKLLRIVSCKYSQKSKEYAFRMAQADEKAAIRAMK